MTSTSSSLSMFPRAVRGRGTMASTLWDRFPTCRTTSRDCAKHFASKNLPTLNEPRRSNANRHFSRQPPPPLVIRAIELRYGFSFPPTIKSVEKNFLVRKQAVRRGKTFCVEDSSVCGSSAHRDTARWQAGSRETVCGVRSVRVPFPEG